MKTDYLNRILALSIAATTAIAGAASEVSGALFDPTLNEGEPFATVRIYRGAAEGRPQFAFLTDAEGRFSQTIDRSGDYTFVFSSLGKEDLVRTVTIDAREDMDLGVLNLNPDVTMMAEVVVVAQKPIVRMEADRMTYSVADDIQSRTQTVLEMLRKVPMVTVDGEDNITVNGSSSFQVYVDGKPSLLFSGNPSQIFKSMPASSVESIEVVTNPGARFDAEGAGGILNIVMSRQGTADLPGNIYNATVSAKGGNKEYGGSFALNARTGRLTTGVNLIYSHNRPGMSTVESRREQPGEVVTTLSEGRPSMPFAMGNISAAYELDSLTTFGASLALTDFKVTSPGFILTGIEGQGASISYGNNASQNIYRRGITGSVDLTHIWGRDRRNQLNASYQIQHERNRNLSTSEFEIPAGSPIELDDRESDNREHTTMHLLQADLTTRINNANSIAVGTKMAVRDASSDAVYRLDGAPEGASSLSYENRSTIAAAYGEYSLTAGTTTAKAGLRYEHTWQKVNQRGDVASGFRTDYGILVPSASLSWNIAPTSNLGLNYNMRISRPGISYLNPYVDRSNPTSLTYGNPDLDVEKKHYVGLVYNLYNSKFMMNLTLSNNYSGNGIEQYSFMKDGLLNTTYGNIVRKNWTGLNAYINWMPWTSTRLFLNGAVSYSDLRSCRLGLSNSGWQGNAMVGLQQTLPAEIKASVFVMASTRSHTLQGWNSGFQMISVSASRSFLDNRLNVSIGASAGLGGGGWMKIENYSANKDFTSLNRISVPMAGFNLGVTYTFGSSSKVQLRSRNTPDNDFIEQKSDMEQLSSPEIGSGTPGATLR